MQRATTISAFRDRLNRRIDPSSLIAFRICYGVLVAIGAIRFLAEGWVDAFFVKPTFFFTFDFAPWVRVGPEWLMTSAVVTVAVLGVLVACGLFYRVSIVALVVIFSYLELTDVTNYLNHYYQLIALGVLLCFMPLGRAGSVDAKRNPAKAVMEARGWMIDLLRFQVGVVYVFAAVAKLNTDWLIHAQPLNIWLLSRTDTPLIGSMLGSFDMALFMSWVGFLHDLLIVPALCWRRSRVLAYGVLVGFHIGTGLLFNIGMFPLIMILTTPIYFADDWPKRVMRRWRKRIPSNRSDAGQGLPVVKPLGRWGMIAVLAWCLIQVAVPARTFAYSGSTNWHEQGMRFSWRVMCRQKRGSVTYRVTTDGRSRERLVFPNKYLTAAQEREMAGQPDLVLQLAHHIGADFKARGYTGVQVRVDALVSLNGRRPSRLIDPAVDLMTVKVSFLTSADWILPAPEDGPIRLEPQTHKAGK